MNVRFYKKALKAAEISPQALLLEFKQPDADANVKASYYKLKGYYGDPLIHTIIEKLPDDKLPAILQILVQHNVDIETKDDFDRNPLGRAASYCKENAVKFLIENKAVINTTVEPPLCRAINYENEEKSLRIIKLLIANKANIDIQDKFSQSPLMKAVELRAVGILTYLLSLKPSLFLKYAYPTQTQYKTALGLAHAEYISTQKCFPATHNYTQDAEKCLNILMQAVEDYLYHHARQETNEALFIKKAIKDLSGKFEAMFRESNNIALQKLLEKEVQPKVLNKIRKEKIHAFCMGSRLKNSGYITSLNYFFNKDGRRDLTQYIFSFLYNDHNISHVSKKKN